MLCAHLGLVQGQKKYSQIQNTCKVAENPKASYNAMISLERGKSIWLYAIFHGCNPHQWYKSKTISFAYESGIPYNKSL